MDMWNWLLDCYNEDSLTIEEMQLILIDDRKAEKLWEEWAYNSTDFIEYVRDEIRPFLKYIKAKK